MFNAARDMREWYSEQDVRVSCYAGVGYMASPGQPAKWEVVRLREYIERRHVVGSRTHRSSGFVTE